MRLIHRVLLSVCVVLMFHVNAGGAGLLAPNDVSLPPLRVTQHLVDVEIHDQIALTTLSQTFRNDTNRRLEATYVFPLPENAELTNFQMSFNGKMVQGNVLPAEEARRVYESIVRQSRDPGLIEFVGRRLLQMRIFPIEPNSDTRIEVKYQQICKPISGMSGFHYPLRTTKASGQSYGSVRFSVKLDTTAALKNVWSPTHPVEVVREGEHVAKIAYEANRGSLDDDFMLLYDTDSSDLGLSVIGYKPSEKQPGYFVLTLTPKQLWPKQDYQPQDVVFVVDTSGSMAGEKIDQARSALKFCIDKLDERDGFNVVRFSTGVDQCFESMVTASKENRAKAREKVDAFTSAGGTNILDALKAALDLRPPSKKYELILNPEQPSSPPNRTTIDMSRPFVIVFITDGQGNQSPEETMKMVKGHPRSEGTRVFPFGVGHDVNTILLDQLATNYSGKPSYVQPGENLELVLGDFFAVISQPVLTNLKLTLPDISATEKFPTSLGDLYHGQQLTIAGKFDSPMTGPVKLVAMRGGEQVEFSWPSVSFTHTAEAKYVPSIWAGRKISYVIDQIRAHGEKPEMVSEIIALSQEFGIQTPYSSWLVNPEQHPEYSWRGRGGPPPPGVIPHGGRGGGGSGSGGGGMSPAPARAMDQRRTLSGSGIDAGEIPTNDAAGGDAWTFEGDIKEAAGKDATRLAQANAKMRESRSKSEGKLNESQLLSRKIGERWYNRIGQFLVDDSFDDKATVTVVKFGSNAYFELVRRKPELKHALAASPNIVVLVDETRAIAVCEDSGIEEFSAEQLQQAGLGERK